MHKIHRMYRDIAPQRIRSQSSSQAYTSLQSHAPWSISSLISLSPANGFLLLKNTNERKNDVTTFNLNFPISLEGQRLWFTGSVQLPIAPMPPQRSSTTVCHQTVMPRNAKSLPENHRDHRENETWISYLSTNSAHKQSNITFPVTFSLFL